MDEFDEDYEYSEIFTKIVNFMEKLSSGYLDISIDAINFPSQDKIFYVNCYISEKGKNFNVGEILPLNVTRH
ncbi:MAG: hypothetical protein NZZ41_03025 [Candidatus Dojkabacteria bacterium]|nr:hypothetical protein [Candidatus Dojkabacteria bacterium]